jgi:hypothetical protein
MYVPFTRMRFEWTRQTLNNLLVSTQSTYLKVLAKAAYFLPGRQQMSVELVTTEMRLWIR